MFEMKNTPEEINGSLDIKEEKISDLKDKARETIQNGTQRETLIFQKMKNAPVRHRTTSSSLINL
jgi:hypothetical protein